jgi:hypothetical protein
MQDSPSVLRARAAVPALLLAAFLAHAARAQGAPTVLPAGTGTLEQGSLWIPGGEQASGSTAPRWRQLLYGAAELAGTTGPIWSSVELRPDARGFAAHSADCAIVLSSRGVPDTDTLDLSAGLRNRGSDAAAVVARRRIALPAVPGRFDSQPQLPFAIPFDRPFAHATGSGLLVELEWQATAFLPLSLFDATSESGRGWTATQTQLGTGCSPTAQTTVALGSGFLASLALTITHDDPSRTPGVPALIAFGRSPQSLALDGLGAPGCSAHVALEILEPVRAFAGLPYWHAEFSLGFDPRYLGQRIAVQTFVLDPAANPAGLIAGSGHELRIATRPSPRRARHLVFSSAQLRDGVESAALPVLGLR